MSKVSKRCKTHQIPRPLEQSRTQMIERLDGMLRSLSPDDAAYVDLLRQQNELKFQLQLFGEDKFLITR